MDKIMKLKDYLLELAFLALLVRVLAVGCGIGEALALVSVVSSMSYNKLLAKKKVEQYDELIARIDANQLEVKSNYDDLSKKYDDVLSKLSSLTMEKSIKRTVNEPQERSITPGTPAKRYF